MEEEADARSAFAGREDEIERPLDAQWPEWSGTVRTAWQALRDDRHYGAMGGLSRIWFSSIDSYAKRYGIAGSGFDEFLKLFSAIDEEYIAHVVAQQAKRTSDNKQ